MLVDGRPLVPRDTDHEPRIGGAGGGWPGRRVIFGHVKLASLLHIMSGHTDNLHASLSLPQGDM